MWDAIKSILLQILAILASYWAGKKKAELDQANENNEITQSQIAIAVRPTLSSDALLERMCSEAGVPTSAISDPESRDCRGIEDAKGS